MIKRTITSQLEALMFKGKAIVLFGARRVGKTTILKELEEKYKEKYKVTFLNCDLATDLEKIQNTNEAIDKYFSNYDLILIDEAQKSPLSTTLTKIIVDQYSDKKQVVLTGSSTLNLLDTTQETLTGRKFVFKLYPFSVSERFTDSFISEQSLEDTLVYGGYPDVCLEKDQKLKELNLTDITSSYLYKDILESQNIKSPDILNKLLKALALQVGSEVSIREVAELIGVNKETVERYIDLLEKSFIIFRLPPLLTNKRKTISRYNKIYFIDLGIRNAIINNLNPLASRDDIGKLWENFLMVERMKTRDNKGVNKNTYFWRTYDGAEVDLVEEISGELNGFEFKFSNKKNVSGPTSFLEMSGTTFETINKDNYIDFVTKS